MEFPDNPETLRLVARKVLMKRCFSPLFQTNQIMDRTYKVINKTKIQLTLPRANE